MSIFTGCATALVTPFIDNNIDYNKLGKIIDVQCSSKVDALVTCATTGEGSTLTAMEKLKIIDYIQENKHSNKIIIANTGTNDTKKSITLSKEVEKLNVDAIMAVAPYYNKGNKQGIISHFSNIADSVNVPLILYNVPSRTSFSLTSEIVGILSEHPNIVGIKEASTDMSHIAEICRLKKDDFFVYAGNDDHIVPILSLGGKGVISVVSNLMPSLTSSIVHMYLNGKADMAKNIMLYLKPLMDAMFLDVNPVPVKYALSLMDRCNEDLRLPLSHLEDEQKMIIDNIMQEYSLINN